MTVQQALSGMSYSFFIVIATAFFIALTYIVCSAIFYAVIYMYQNLVEEYEKYLMKGGNSANESINKPEVTNN